MCEGGVDLQQSPVQLQCPLQAPRGLQVSIRGEAVAVRPREDVLFVVRQEQVSIRPGLALTGSFSQAPKVEALNSLKHGHEGLRPDPKGRATGPKLASCFRPVFEMKQIQEQVLIRQSAGNGLRITHVCTCEYMGVYMCVCM